MRNTKLHSLINYSCGADVPVRPVPERSRRTRTYADHRRELNKGGCDV